MANTAPTATNMNQTVRYTEDASSVVLGDIMVSDPDTGDTITASLTLSNRAAGVLTTGTFGSATSTFDAASGVWTVTGSTGDVNQALAAVSFTPARDFDSYNVIFTRVQDAAGDGPAPNIIVLDVTPVNDDPTATGVPSDLTFREGVAGNLDLSGITFSDVDSRTGNVTFTIAASSGTLAAASGDGVTVGGTGSDLLTLTGMAERIDAFLEGQRISYTSAIGVSGDNAARLTLTANDRGNSGSGGGTDVALGTVNLDITANAAPVARDDTGLAQERGGTGNATPGVDPTGNLVTGLGAGGSAADTDDRDASSALTVVAVHTGAEGSAGQNAGTVGQALTGLHGRLTLNSDGDYTYTVAQNDAAVQALAPGQSLTDTFNYTIQDSGGLRDTATVTFTINGADDAVTATNLSAAETYREDMPLDLTDIVVSDPDTASVVASLALTHPTAGSLSTGNGATYDSANGIWAVTGSVAQVNAALAAVTFTPTANFSGGFSIDSYVVAGNTAVNGTKTFTGTAVNDAPTATGVPSDVTVASGIASNVDLSGIAFSDADSGSAAVSFTINAGAGTLSAASGGSVTVSGAGTGALTLTGTAANIDAFLNGASNITYTSAPNARGNDAATLTLTANDQGHTVGGGGTDVPLGTVRLDVTEAPSLVVTTLSDVVDAYDGLTSLREAVDDANVDRDADTITFASNLTGTVRLDGGDGAGGVEGGSLYALRALTIDGGGRITISGDVADNDATRAGTDITDLAATSASNLTDNVRVIGAGADLTLKGLVLTGGRAIDQSDAYGGGVVIDSGKDLTIVDSTISGNAAGRGGGIFHVGNGSLTLTGSTVSGNSANSQGGGIGIRAGGEVTVTGSTLSGNVAGRGGGLFADTNAEVTLTNTTIAGNTATGDDGGGVSLRADSRITLTNTTVTGNVSAGDGGGIDAGESHSSGSATTTLINSIVAGNAATGRGQDLYGDDEGSSLVFEGGNIIGSQPGDFSPVSGLAGVRVVDGGSRAAMESVFGTVAENNGRFGGVLGDNGGPVQTVALAPGSLNPALDASDGRAPASDARGLASVDQAALPNTNGSARDLGAYEVTDAVEAPSLVVTTLSDVVDGTDGQTSLREALAYANARAGADTITFASNLTGTIRLDGGDGTGGSIGGTLSVTEALTIDGAGRIAISGDVADNDATRSGTDITDLAATNAASLTDNVRLFDTASDLTLKGLVLTGGHVAGRGGAVNAAAQKTVTIENSTVAGNGTDGVNGFGGAISSSTVIATGSTFSDNHASAGGGAIAGSGVRLTDSTVSGNSSVLYGGGVTGDGVTLTNVTVSGNSTTGERGSGGGVYASRVTLTNSTVTGNTTADATALGGGIAASTVTLANSILLGNVARAADDDEIAYGFPRERVTLLGGNIVGRDGGGGADVFSGDTDVGNTNASAVFARTVDLGGGVLAGVLADNGGAVRTVALNANVANPAIDAADSSALASDARGFARFDFGGVPNGSGGTGADLGAFELQGFPIPAGLVSYTAGDTYDPANSTGVPISIYFGPATNYTATAATVNGRLFLTLGNGRVSEVIDLGANPKALGLDFSTNTAAVSLTGGDYGDRLVGGAGADTLTGLGGNDSYIVDNRADRVIEAAGGGIDSVYARGSYALEQGQDIEVLATARSISTRVLDLTGNEKAQILYGNQGANVLDGGGGADTLHGNGGNDRYIVDEAGDRVFEVAGAGSDDRVYASASYALTAGQEIEVLATTNGSGTQALDLTGNEKGQTLYGNRGVNVLDGKGGADALAGGNDADIFAFSTALGGGNIDRIVDFASGDTIRLAKTIFTALDRGTLDDGAFKDLSVSGARVDADDRILYDGKGRLYYDADGVGGSEAVLFAKLSYRPELTHDDVFVV